MQRVFAPTQALVLWSVLTIGGLVAGFMLGSWLLPTGLALSHDGLAGFREIPSSWGWAKAPGWMEHRAAQWVGFAGGCIGLALAALLAIKGAKLSHWLIVEKFRWMTEEEVQRYNSRPRVM